MEQVICPCGCGESFEPIVHGSKQKYFSPACGNRFRVRKCQKKKRKEKRQAAKVGQRALKFQPIPKSERRAKIREPVQPKPVEEQLFA
jgi:hypothetical protein